MEATPQHPRDLVLQHLPKGPVTLLVAVDHPRNVGLPATFSDHIVVLVLADAEDRVDLRDPTVLRVHYLNDGDPALATVDWDAVFAVAGFTAPNQLQSHLRHDAVPAGLEPDRVLNAQRLLHALGLGAVPPRSADWNFDASPRLLAADADRSEWCADKREAFERLLVRPPGDVLLLIDPQGPNVEIPEPLRQAPHGQLRVARRPPWVDLVVGDHGVGWGERIGPDGVRFEVPWTAVGGMRSLDNQVGWFWPQDLPSTIQTQLQQAGDVWSVLMHLHGVPLPPTAPGPVNGFKVLNLQAPQVADKRTALSRCVKLGMCVAVIDTTRQGVVLAPPLPGSARQMMVPLRLPNLDPHFVADEVGFMAVMPDFAGRVVPVRVPWDAVFLIADPPGSRIYAWPQDYPDDILTALHALRSAQRTDGAETDVPGVLVKGAAEAGLGTDLELLRGDDGGFVLRLSQPVGGPQALPGGVEGSLGRAVMGMEFRLPVTVGH